MTAILVTLGLLSIGVLIAFRGTLCTLLFLIRFELAMWILNKQANK
jgi:hypothetical protein